MNTPLNKTDKSGLWFSLDDARAAGIGVVTGNWEMSSINLKNERNQPIKSISHQDIYSLHDLLEQLNSWQNALSLLDDFFSDKQRPVNKKKIASDYYACSHIFSSFHNDFLQTLPKIKKQIDELRYKEKI